MIVGRVIGWVLLLIGLAVAGYEIVNGLSAPKYHIVSLGELWFKIDVQTLNGLQVVIQRHLGWPWLWDGAIVHILKLPAWVVFIVPGIIMALLFRRRRQKRGGFG